MAATLSFPFREQWREIKRGRPGKRFQERYQRARLSQRRSGTVQRILSLLVGLVAVAIGVLLVAFPGPAIPFFFIGGALLAAESRPVARLMDWAEVKLRVIGAWAKLRWKRLPQLAQVALLVLGAACSAASAYLGYRLMRD